MSSRSAPDVVAVGTGQLLGGWPAFQQPQECRRAEVAVGDVDGRREHGQQIGAQAVAQPALVTGGAVVVAGDGAQFGAGFTVRDQLAQLGVRVQREPEDAVS
jgi:hypothetical protein